MATKRLKRHEGSVRANIGRTIFGKTIIDSCLGGKMILSSNDPVLLSVE